MCTKGRLRFPVAAGCEIVEYGCGAGFDFRHLHLSDAGGEGRAMGFLRSEWMTW